MTRRHRRRAAPLGVLLAGLVAGSLLCATSVAHAHAEPGSPESDKQAARSRTSSAKLQADGSLSDVAGLSEKDVWAVGQQDVWDFWQNQGVITHWNGTAWTEVDVRNDTTGAGHLRSVAAAGKNDVWAVGDGHDGLPYVARGNRDGFDRLTMPQLRAGDWLGAVAATSGRVVLVGSRDGRTFAAAAGGPSWTTWDTVQGPVGALYGVALAGKSEGWAVGDSGSRPLIMRLTSSGWKLSHVPVVKGGFLRDVYVQSRKRALAVGGVYQRSGKITPLVLTWDGESWTREKLPIRQAELYGVTGDGDGAFWVSGFDPQRPGTAFLLTYTGSKWKVVYGDSVPDRTVRLQAVTRVGETTMAVGHTLDASDRYRDVIETFGSPAK
ncbi:hypothetical protein [Microtetraspora sp. AC03309]|uniref:hypothetical protein n=1 Tax=Microtetraspora sp. AC03309 TaxID=2779376 RepID=UPI001E53FF81|nr:hypothetical protein [Microtetraspora sp. AC03309]